MVKINFSKLELTLGINYTYMAQLELAKIIYYCQVINKYFPKHPNHKHYFLIFLRIKSTFYH